MRGIPQRVYCQIQRNFGYNLQSASFEKNDTDTIFPYIFLQFLLANVDLYARRNLM